MSKKFDVVIGNPPYQDEATGDATHNMPVYHLFMEAAYEVGRKAVLITLRGFSSTRDTRRRLGTKRCFRIRT
jgi:23S rRNA G2445 N2-methylase RlmL